MSFEIYKVIHLLGVFMVLVPLGAIVIHMANGGTRNHPSRRLLGMTHSVGLLLSLIGGFGLLARLGTINGLPGWIYAKLGIWLFFGGMTALVYKKGDKATAWWTLIFVLGATAAYLARYKPF